MKTDEMIETKLADFLENLILVLNRGIAQVVVALRVKAWSKLKNAPATLLPENSMLVYYDKSSDTIQVIHNS